MINTYSSTTFLRKAIWFWFVLLFLALLNATIRELFYEPLLFPHIGIWAHQLSSLTAILLFSMAIYFFLGRVGAHSQKDLLTAGAMWFAMTLAFESAMNIFMRKLTFQEVLETYYFWNGETWIFVLLFLLVAPLVIDRYISHRSLSN